MNIKIDASSIFEDERKFALIYIDLETLKCVSDVIYHIANILHIQVKLSNQNGCELSLYDDKWYIPPGQSSSIFQSIAGVLRLCYAKVEGQIESQSVLENQFQADIEKNETYMNTLPALEESYNKTRSCIYVETGHKFFTDCEQYLQDNDLGKSENIISNSATSIMTSGKREHKKINASQTNHLGANEVVIPVVKCISEVTSPQLIETVTKDASVSLSLEPPSKKLKKKHKKKKLRDCESQGFFPKQMKYEEVTNSYNRDTQNDNHDEIESSHIAFDANGQKTSLEDRLAENSLNTIVELQLSENKTLFSTPVNDLSNFNSDSDPNPATMPHAGSFHHVGAEASELNSSCLQKSPLISSNHLNIQAEKSFPKCSQSSITVQVPSPEILSFSPLIQNGMNPKDDENPSFPVHPEISMKDENEPTSPKAHIGFKGHRTKKRRFQSVGNILNALKNVQYPPMNESIQDSDSNAIHSTSAERNGSALKNNELCKDDEIVYNSTSNMTSSFGETECRTKSATQTDQLGVEVEHIIECASKGSSPQATDTSLKDFSDSCFPAPPRKKRKRKHNKKRKKSLESFQKQWEYKDVNSFKKYRKRNDSYDKIQPDHIFFNESNQETSLGNRSADDSPTNTSDSKFSEKKSFCPTSVLDSCCLNLSPDKNTKTTHIGSSYKEEGSVESEESEDLASPCLQNSPSVISTNDHLNDHTEKFFPVCPPQPSITFQEPSPEILSKFKNLLALEDKLEPVVFKRCAYGLPQYQEDEVCNSLPMAFGSQKQMKYGQRLHQPFSSQSSRQDRMNPKDNKNNSLPLYPRISLEKKEPPSLKIRTAFKGDRTRTRYSQSVGNILNALKNHENSPGNKSATETIVQDSDSMVIHATSKEMNGNANLVKDYTFEHSETSQALIKVKIGADGNYIKNEDGVAVKENNSPEFWAGGKCMSKEKKVGMSDSKRVASVDEDEYNHDIPIYDLEAEIKREEKENQEWCNISYESYPLLSSPPKVGDIIGAKLCSSDISSHISTYRPAKVIVSEAFKLKVQFLDVMNSGDEFEKRDTYNVLDWRDLMSPRLLFP